MPVPPHNAIKPGSLVSIVLKQDQRSGRQVQGSVSQLLTRGDHPRGVKVRLSDGRVGRVQQLVSPTSSTASATGVPAQKKYYRNINTMDNNPWANAESHGTPYNHHDNPPRNQAYQPSHNTQDRYQADSQQQTYYSPPPGPPQQYASLLDEPSPWGDAQERPQRQQQQQQQPAYAQSYQEPFDSQQYNPPVGSPPLPQRGQRQDASQRSEIDNLLPQSDRAEQVEHMQEYESHARLTEDDRNRAQLEKEFPSVDGALIAALYGDSKDMAETRELLQELARGQ